MDTRRLLDQLLQSGRELVAQGQAFAEQQFGVPESGPERERVLSAMGKGAAAAGAAAVLLGTRTGRAVTGGALKVASLAALGGLAYTAYQDWQAKALDAPANVGTPVNQLEGQPAEHRSRSLLKAMIAAAKADGHIDEAEQVKIDTFLKSLALDDETLHFVKAEIAKPLDVKDVAAGADSPAAATEIYLTSLTYADPDNEEERAYLSQLAKELKLAPDLISSLEAQRNIA
jgi:uncharacterized membrane protein YebE (DUF533 family)